MHLPSAARQDGDDLPLFTPLADAAEFQDGKRVTSLFNIWNGSLQLGSLSGVIPSTESGRRSLSMAERERIKPILDKLRQVLFDALDALAPMQER